MTRLQVDRCIVESRSAAEEFDSHLIEPEPYRTALQEFDPRMGDPRADGTRPGATR